MLNTDTRTLLVITVLFLLPGWSILSITGLWKKWPTLQRWCVAIGASIAFYPVLYYAVREILPGFSLGTRKMQLFLLLNLIVIIYFQRKTWKEQFSFDRFEWLSILVIFGTLLTRFWAAQNNPFPAWSDSLHHTLLTQLTAQTGILPVTLAPYEPVPLDMYHLGLYSLTGLVEQLAKIPAYTSVLWVSQALNGLCGVGTFLVLDRIAGRRGAFVGTAVAGFFSQMPAYYVNWGRFTQVAGQALMLIAWIITLESVRLWRQSQWKGKRFELASLAMIAALLTAGMFLFHFRVAVFYLPLLGIGLLWELICSLREKTASKLLAGIGIVGLVSLVFIAPVLYRAAQAYMQSLHVHLATSSAAQSEVSRDIYFNFPLRSLFTLGVQPWLFALTCLAVAAGMVFKNRWMWVFFSWVMVLVLLGFLYLLNIPALNVTNMGAVLIMLYLPVALIIGLVVEDILLRIPLFRQPAFDRYFVWTILLICFLLTNSRVNQIESARFFVTNDDVNAMNWITANTSQDAVFAINTYFWMPGAPQGTDAGYWIPYFTGRKTTSGVMISNLGGPAYRDTLIQRSTLAKKLETDTSALSGLRSAGVDYVYIGKKGNFSRPGLNPVEIAKDPLAELVYSQKGVTIFKIRQPVALK